MSRTQASPRTLPPDLDHIAGLRVARWVRESTAGQMDFYGPAAQARLIEQSIERHALVDTGIGWSVAASGWKRAWLTPAWQEMLEAARQGRFDLLLVAYQSRFLRNVKMTLIVIEDELHPAGVAVYFIDERVLSSDPEHWHPLVDEALDAEQYSRRMAKRQREGHAAKRRTGEPGGRPPYGFARAGEPPILVEIPERIARLRALYRQAAEGGTDRQLAVEFGLRPSHVAELLTNPIYIGRLRDGNRRTPVIEDALWAQVADMRARHSRRHPGPVTYRQYRWSGLLVCRSCGRRLTGHCERYRHVDACEPFRRAQPARLGDRRVKGDSYPADVYDAVASRALAHIVASAALIAEVEQAVDAAAPPASQFTLARIARDRRDATRRLDADRDTATWLATMSRLDVEEVEAHATIAPRPGPREVAQILADMAGLYTDATPQTQHRILQALFEQVEVLGSREVWLHPSLEAEERGWAAAMSGEFRVEVRQTGRGERI